MPPRRVITGRSQEPRRRYAEELRLLRTARGESLRELAKVVGWDASLFGKLERELAVADPTQFKERYRRYMLLESEAVNLWHFGVSTIHGLLQTEAYAYEVLALGGAKGKELDQQVGARTGRRKLLEGVDAPPFRALLAEAVLRTPLRDAGAWREQLEYLLKVSERPNITLQVLPHTSGLHGLVSTDVMFLRLLDGATVAYTENAHRGELIEENASVERLQRTYDAMRDQALNPAESRKFITRMLEEVPCEPST